MENNDIKLKIEKTVQEYKKMFPEEYSAIVQWIKDIQSIQDTKYAEMPSSGMTERKLGEMPETLHTMITKKLSSEERSYFFEKEESKKLNRWFFNKFKEFRITHNI